MRRARAPQPVPADLGLMAFDAATVARLFPKPPASAPPASPFVSPTVSTASLAPAQRPADPVEWGSTEHWMIGNKAFMRFWGQIKIRAGAAATDAAERALYQLLRQAIDPRVGAPARISFGRNNLRVQAGAIVALGGDFMGVPDKPICLGDEHTAGDTPADRFNSAYRVLSESTQEEVDTITDQIGEEEKIMRVAFNKGQKPNIMLEKVGGLTGPLNRGYANVTAAASPFSINLLHSRYSKLAANNFDHFGSDAVKAYMTGHQAALGKAGEAHRESNPARKVALLLEAFAMELFACHFLTDLTSAGHVRAPRRSMYDFVQKSRGTPLKSPVAGFLIKVMHDEDSEKGLWVTCNKALEYAASGKDMGLPTVWRAYGDGCYFEEENEGNTEWAQFIVATALHSVHSASLGASVDARDMLDYIPYLCDDPSKAAQIATALAPKPNATSFPRVEFDQATGSVKVIESATKTVEAVNHDPLFVFDPALQSIFVRDDEGACYKRLDDPAATLYRLWHKPSTPEPEALQDANDVAKWQAVLDDMKDVLGSDVADLLALADKPAKSKWAALVERMQSVLRAEVDQLMTADGDPVYAPGPVRTPAANPS